MKNKKNKTVFDSIISFVVEWVSIILVALVVALFVNNVIITNSYIPTPSMESNLPVGSRLFGFRLNYLFSKPKRGDVVIFDFGFDCKNCHTMYQKNEQHRCPNCRTEEKGSKKVHFIKRVIGLPGERIEVKADYFADTEFFRTRDFSDGVSQVQCGHVYIDGEKYDEDYLNEPMLVNDFFKSVDVTVPEDSYFLLGDNRNNSEDARFWPNQFISMKDIEAKAYIIYWPLNKFGLIY